MDTRQAAEKWNISERRVRVLCSKGRIPGAFQIGRGWIIPEDSIKPNDARRGCASDCEEKKVHEDRRDDFTIIAGPCAVESEEQIMAAAHFVRMSGADMLRGGAYKPRTSPYTFQGLGQEGLRLLRMAGDAENLPIVTEVVDVRDVDVVSRYADMIQIGTRNMQNVPLLVEAAKTGKPILLKRGMNATVEEFLYAAEYIISNGNNDVILCERGLRTGADTYTRNTLDLSAVAVLKRLTNLRVIVDPSHATGRRELIRPMSLAAVMSGCDGLMMEMHPKPSRALSDARQQIDGPELMKLVRDVRKTVIFRKELEK